MPINCSTQKNNFENYKPISESIECLFGQFLLIKNDEGGNYDKLINFGYSTNNNI